MDMMSEHRAFIVKVCGLREHEQIHALLALPQEIRPRMLGMILYEQSPRFAQKSLSPDIFSVMRTHDSCGVIVTVNMEIDALRTLVVEQKPDAVQLHGEESVAYLQTLRSAFPSLVIIKAISIAEDDTTDHVIAKARLYEGCSDYFLFDTASKARGGTGVQFDWQLLTTLPQDIAERVILAGGIADADVERIALLAPMIAGIDINSKFESAPAHKDIPRITAFLEHLSSLIFTNV